MLPKLKPQTLKLNLQNILPHPKLPRFSKSPLPDGLSKFIGQAHPTFHRQLKILHLKSCPPIPMVSLSTQTTCQLSPTILLPSCLPSHQLQSTIPNRRGFPARLTGPHFPHWDSPADSNRLPVLKVL